MCAFPNFPNFVDKVNFWPYGMMYAMANHIKSNYTALMELHYDNINLNDREHQLWLYCAYLTAMVQACLACVFANQV